MSFCDPVKKEFANDQGAQKKVGVQKNSEDSKPKLSNDETKKRFKCPQCQKDFFFNSALKQHSTIHTGERPHKCDVCNKTFRLAQVLRNHIMCHTGERPHTCDICKKAFRQQVHLTAHMKSHTGENLNKFKCPECLKCFAYKNTLKAHMTVHVNDKPHVCDICGKAFRLPRYLKNHKLCHPDKKSYKCPVCSQLFPFLYVLKNHMSSHTDEGSRILKCSDCLKVFLAKSSLKQHSLIHAGEKPHECNMLHTGEMPYECEFCGKRARTKTLLNKHLHFLYHAGHLNAHRTEKVVESGNPATPKCELGTAELDATIKVEEIHIDDDDLKVEFDPELDVDLSSPFCDEMHSGFLKEEDGGEEETVV